MCFEYAEMVRFYHAVYRVVYHPQVAWMLHFPAETPVRVIQ